MIDPITRALTSTSSPIFATPFNCLVVSRSCCLSDYDSSKSHCLYTPRSPLSACSKSAGIIYPPSLRSQLLLNLSHINSPKLMYRIPLYLYSIIKYIYRTPLSILHIISLSIKILILALPLLLSLIYPLLITFIHLYFLLIS